MALSTVDVGKPGQRLGLDVAVANLARHHKGLPLVINGLQIAALLVTGLTKVGQCDRYASRVAQLAKEGEGLSLVAAACW